MRTLIMAVFVLTVALARKWIDSTGEYTVEAEFVDFKDGKIQLRKANGNVVAVPIEKLSESDRAFVKSASAEAAPDAARK